MKELTNGEIKSFLNDAGLTQKAFSEMLAMHPSVISQYLSGKRTMPMHVRKYITLFIHQLKSSHND